MLVIGRRIDTHQLFARLSFAPNLWIFLPVGAEPVVVEMVVVVLVAGRDIALLRVVRVVEAVAVGFPCEAAEFGVRDLLAGFPAGRHIDYGQRAVLGAAGGFSVRDFRSVVGW